MMSAYDDQGLLEPREAIFEFFGVCEDGSKIDEIQSS